MQTTQLVRTADLTTFMSLLRPAEIDGKKDESDAACKARPESSTEIINLFISPGSTENFPFIVADVFLNSVVGKKRTWPIGRAGRARQMMMNTKEISSTLTANKSRHFIISHI